MATAVQKERFVKYMLKRMSKANIRRRIKFSKLKKLKSMNEKKGELVTCLRSGARVLIRDRSQGQ